eukprot:8713180-Pyramimonas_sp.AAC.1
MEGSVIRATSTRFYRGQEDGQWRTSKANTYPPRHCQFLASNLFGEICLRDECTEVNGGYWEIPSVVPLLFLFR